MSTRVIVWIIVVLILAAGAYVYFNRGAEEAGESSGLEQMETGSTTPGSIEGGELGTPTASTSMQIGGATTTH